MFSIYFKLCFLLSTLWEQAYSESMMQFSKVYVEESRMDRIHYYLQTASESFTTSEQFAAVSLCSRIDWCNLVCHLNAITIKLFEMMVSPFYQNNTEGYICYTRMPKDLSFGKNITGMDGSMWIATRNPQDFISGIYSGLPDDCAQYEEPGNYNWMLIDFGQKTKITKILVTNNPAWTHLLPTTLEIRIGDTPQIGNFSSYRLIETVVRADMALKQIFTVEPIRPVYGRYLAFD